MRLLKSIGYKSVALAFGALLIHGCGSGDEPTATINFLELNDLHAHLVPHVEQVRENDKPLLSTRGGLARIKSKMDELKGDNTIIMNIGDTFHGGAEALFSNGNDIVTLVNELPIDIAVMGNWDYAYGAALTMARFGNSSDANVEHPNFEYIAANVTYRIPLAVQNGPLPADKKLIAASVFEKVFKFKAGNDFMASTKIIEKSGVKVGFIGITSDIVDRMSPLLAPMLNFTQGEQNYIDLIEKKSDELKAQGAHIIVVMSELGIHKDTQLANKIKANSVNVFFSAHTHEATFTMIDTTSGAKVIESGDDTYLGEMNVTVTAGSVSGYSWKLHEITQDIVPDADLLAKVNAVRAKYLENNVSIISNTITPNMQAADLNVSEVQIAKVLFTRKPKAILLDAPLNKLIGTTTLALTRKNVLENGFNSVFAKLLMNSHNTDIAIVPGFRYDDAIIPSKANYTGVNDYDWINEVNVVLDGNITIENIYRFLPSTNYVATADITGANIKLFVENELTSAFSKDTFNQAGGWMPGITGLKMSVDVEADDGYRLKSISNLNDTAIEDTITLSVASACAREFEPTPLLATTTICGQALFSGVTRESTTTANFLIDAFSKNLDENLSDEKNIHDLSNTLLWPKSPYVQPISQIQ